jgi:hypothetical protein
LTRFLHANRYPPRIKSGAGFGFENALGRRLQPRRRHPLFDAGGSFGLLRLAQQPLALPHAFSSSRVRPQLPGFFGEMIS